jgi:hypothetical protein
VWIENYKPSDNFDPAAFEEEREEEEVNVSARQRRAAFMSGTMWYQAVYAHIRTHLCTLSLFLSLSVSVSYAYAQSIPESLSLSLCASPCRYELGFVIFPIIAVITDEPLFTIYSLFEVCLWEGSRTIIDAILINLTKMSQVRVCLCVLGGRG